ncbi:MAG: transposase, partial [Candidatus Acidiferrales bacterium]
MAFDPLIHHRRSIRLKGFDYSSRGLYFVTICTHRREQFLGRIENAQSIPAETGKAVLAAWFDLPRRFPSVELDAFVVMPNHVHGILVLVGTGMPVGGHFIRGAASSAPTLGDVMRAFKSISGIAINRILGRSGVPAWQRNYYEHIIRDSRELDGAQRYIADNPLRWQFDPENPLATHADGAMPWGQ